MENYLKILRKFFIRLSDSLNGGGYRAIKPVFYWKCLIFVFIFGLIFIASLNIYLFLYFDRYSFGQNEQQYLNGDERNTLNKSKIIKISEELKKREMKLSELMEKKLFINEP